MSESKNERKPKERKLKERNQKGENQKSENQKSENQKSETKRAKPKERKLNGLKQYERKPNNPIKYTLYISVYLRLTPNLLESFRLKN